jgi:hypothetical protein
MKGSTALAKNIEKRARVDPKTNCGFKSSIQEKFNNKLEGPHSKGKGNTQTTHILLPE